MHQAEFNDPRLVVVHDAESPWSREDEFFLSAADEAPASRVLDLGCGTGRLALGLAAAGHQVTGVDPARASLDAARTKPGAERVTWIVGTMSDVPEQTFDMAVMTSHVSQFLIDDQEWDRALADLARLLRPGGRLLFDARDPQDRRWDAWNPVDSRHQVALPDGREVAVWTEVTAVRDSRVSFTHHYVFPDGDELLSTATLRFRTEDELRNSLHASGFVVDKVYGGWRRQRVGQGDGELIVIARA
jgi:SAM-dependent methyltransferase